MSVENASDAEFDLVAEYEKIAQASKSQYASAGQGVSDSTVNAMDVEVEKDFTDDVDDGPLEIEVDRISSDGSSDDNESSIVPPDNRPPSTVVDVVLDDEEEPNTPLMSDEEDDIEFTQGKETVCDSDFSLMQTFKDAKSFRKVVTDYSIMNHRPLKFERSNTGRVEAICLDPKCPWRIWCSIERRLQKFQIKTYEDKHTCVESNINPLCDSRWLASTFLEKFRRNNNFRAADLRAECLQMYGVSVSYHQCFRARQKALRKIQGSQTEHFAKLRHYQNELLKTNRGSTVLIQTDDPTPEIPIFRRMYICFDALRKGWSAGCRPIIGLDGAFLKWFVKGELLAAVGKDANNQMYPIAWAVVEVENTDSWSWFIRLLTKDLALGTGAGFTMVTDGQKGLLHAIKDILPNARHRSCGRHIYANWRKIWKQRELKPLFWAVARAYTIGAKDEALGEIRKLSAGAAHDLERSCMEGWCRVYFTDAAVCDVVHNNMSESFNSSIRGARSKPIINMLEDIRIACIERMANRIETISKWEGDITPKAQLLLNENLAKSHYARAIFNGRHKWEVHSTDDVCVVDMELKTCSCREWSLSGIPCYHALTVITRTKGDITDYVSQFYSTTLWKKTYDDVLNPINGERMWPKSNVAAIRPPKTRKMPGRPKRNRVKDRAESPPKKGTTSRQERIMTCTHCHQPGHNKSTCAKRKNGEPPEDRSQSSKTGRPATEDRSQASTSTKRMRKPKTKNVPSDWNLSKNKETSQDQDNSVG